MTPAPHWRDLWPELAPDAGAATLRHHALHGGDFARLIEHLREVRPLRLGALADPEPTPDEAWLLALLAAHRRGDRASYAFLLLSRLDRTRASSAHFLLCRAALALEVAG